MILEHYFITVAVVRFFSFFISFFKIFFPVSSSKVMIIYEKKGTKGNNGGKKRGDEKKELKKNKIGKGCKGHTIKLSTYKIFFSIVYR